MFTLSSAVKRAKNDLSFPGSTSPLALSLDHFKEKEESRRKA